MLVFDVMFRNDDHTNFSFQNAVFSVISVPSCSKLFLFLRYLFRSTI